jgi:hypothetical protein
MSAVDPDIAEPASLVGLAKIGSLGSFGSIRADEFWRAAGSLGEIEGKRGESFD